MIISVTGGNGFIGSILVNRLIKEGHEVRVLTRRHTASKNHFLGDLSDPSVDLTQFLTGADALIHCAGEVKDEAAMHELHVEGTKRLINQAKGKIKHWVHLSSVGVYGKIRNGVVDENSSPSPVGVYEKTKSQSDDLVIEAAAQGYFTVAILRPSNVFGPTMTNRSLFGLIGTIKKGLFFYIGPKGAMTNYIPVENVIEGLILCLHMRSNPVSVFNLSDDMPLEDFVGLISKHLRITPPRIRIPKILARLLSSFSIFTSKFPLTPSRVDALTGRVRYSDQKIRSELNYRPVIHMDQAVQNMLTPKMSDEGIRRNL